MRDWRVTATTAQLKDRAWAQLGTSGSGNHFVEFGTLTVLTIEEASRGSEATYLAVIDAYRKTFEQQSVLWESARVCGAA